MGSLPDACKGHCQVTADFLFQTHGESKQQNK
jgi:hypothetical protein